MCKKTLHVNRTILILSQWEKQKIKNLEKTINRQWSNKLVLQNTQQPGNNSTQPTDKQPDTFIHAIPTKTNQEAEKRKKESDNSTWNNCMQCSKTNSQKNNIFIVY